MKIIHLSDLHFGTEREGLVERLIDDIHKMKPHIIAVSGDLTQRARQNQYLAAKEFLQCFPNVTILCVPGNHDIPLYNLIERFFFPLKKYQKFITKDLHPQCIQGNVAILGINSATPFKPMGGFVTDKQLYDVSHFFQKQPTHTIKIMVMHHNLIRSERHQIINDSEKIINAFASCNINLVLSGHIHVAYIEQLKRNYLAHNMYVITAGTAISTRTSSPNSYNLIELSDDHFELTVREFNGHHFFSSKKKSYKF